MIPGDALSAFAFVSESAAMCEVLAQVGKAAASPAGVMLTGGPGTGRGLIARAIHACAHSDHAPFVALDCRALLPAESERALFGVPAGGGLAGAAAGRTRGSVSVEVVHPGSLLHSARGGTIAFRNLDELPVRVQARLATLFRDREFKTRSGGEAQLFTARPVAVVDPGFHALVDEGRVRPDLYRRFAEIQIQVPSLRERHEDIPALAQLFLSRACGILNIEEKTMDQASQTVLAALPWHGNARELKDLLQSLAPVTPEATISLGALLEHITLDASNGVHPTLGASLREARRRFEREYIAAVVAQHHGRIPDAAKSLGIQRTNLYRKLRTLRLETPDAGNGGDRSARPGPT
jgi:two-component system nitrogen regulation response regulator NtrX